MIEYYKREQFEEKLNEVEAIKNKKSDEYFIKYMKIILSFARPIRLSKKGDEMGKDLYDKWLLNTEKLTREEHILAGFLLSDISIMTEDSQMASDLNKIYNQMVAKHKPDFQYMQEFGGRHLLERGYFESNPNYMETAEQMFTMDYVIPDPDQMRMINTGEMPIYDKVKACPYCGKQFPDDGVEDLFKHVKAEHDKK